MSATLSEVARSVDGLTDSLIALALRAMQTAIDQASAWFDWFVANQRHFNKRDVERMRKALQAATQAAARLNE